MLSWGTQTLVMMVCMQWLTVSVAFHRLCETRQGATCAVAKHSAAQPATVMQALPFTGYAAMLQCCWGCRGITIVKDIYPYTVELCTDKDSQGHGQSSRLIWQGLHSKLFNCNSMVVAW